MAAHVIEKALGGIDLNEIQLLIVENVGNLVCPAEFDIGEDARVVILSVTEGEDKPLKYPLMFRECDAAILNKIDLPSADPESVREEIEEIIGLDASDAVVASAKAGIGIDEILESIVAKIPPPEGDPEAPLNCSKTSHIIDRLAG